MKEQQEPLTTRQFWADQWANKKEHGLPFNPRRGSFGSIHKLLQKILPHDSKLSFLEIGCYPGRFMWYFERFFGYRVEGVEYIDWCCERTGELLLRAGVNSAAVHYLDFISWEPEAHEQWDVVASFGFAEHFSDYVDIVAKHARLVRPGGWLVLEIPNHTGFYGRILKILDPVAWSVHNRIGLEQLESSVARIEEMQIIAAKPCGKFSLAHVCLLERSRKAGRLIHLAVLGMKLALELLMYPFPRSRSLSPYLVVVARKQSR